MASICDTIRFRGHCVVMLAYLVHKPVRALASVNQKSWLIQLSKYIYHNFVKIVSIPHCTSILAGFRAAQKHPVYGID
jgi:hypothetical protein